MSALPSKAAVWLACLAAAISTAGCLDFFTGDAAGPAPAFSLLDIDGNTHSLDDYAGRVLLLDFMGTWCGPCQRGVPFMGELLEAYPNLAILSVSSTDSNDQLADFRVQFGAHWPLAVDTDSVVARYVDAGSGRNRVLWPSYALVNDGQLVFFNEGETLPATLSRAIDGAAGPAPRDPWLIPVAAAASLGFLAWFSPFLYPETALRERAQLRRILPWFLPATLITFGALAAIAAGGARPLTGRAYNGATLLLVATPVAFLWWRKREREHAPADAETDRPAWRVGALMPLNVAYHGVPAWGAIVLAGMLSLDPMLGARLQLAFGAGVAAAGLATWRTSLGQWLGQRAGWVGAAGWGLGFLWLMWLRIIP